MAPPPDSAPVVTATGSATGRGGVSSRSWYGLGSGRGSHLVLDRGAASRGRGVQVDALEPSGTFAWIPDFSQAGSYVVTFTAVSTLTTAATASLTIADTDRAPAIVAPKAAEGEEGGTLTFIVTASDPDGESISGVSADLFGLRPGPPPPFTHRSRSRVGRVRLAHEVG